MLLDPERAREARLRIARAGRRGGARANSRSCSSFALGDNKLREEDEQRLYDAGRGLGLGATTKCRAAIDAELARLGASACRDAPVGASAAAPAAAPASGGACADRRRSDPFAEFRRMLRMSRLCLDGEEMTDDQRDAMCNIGESLGLTGGQAEDLIDEYLDEVERHAAASAGRRARA